MLILPIGKTTVIIKCLHQLSSHALSSTGYLAMLQNKKENSSVIVLLERPHNPGRHWRHQDKDLSLVLLVLIVNLTQPRVTGKIVLMRNNLNQVGLGVCPVLS